MLILVKKSLLARFYADLEFITSSWATFGHFILINVFFPTSGVTHCTIKCKLNIGTALSVLVVKTRVGTQYPNLVPLVIKLGLN